MNTPSKTSFKSPLNKPVLVAKSWAATHGMGAKDVCALGFYVLRTVALMGAIIFSAHWLISGLSMNWGELVFVTLLAGVLVLGLFLMMVEWLCLPHEERQGIHLMRKQSWAQAAPEMS